ncbi:MAG: hypothetical protein ACXVJD_04705 [Mucilaginibacter sp.]
MSFYILNTRTDGQNPNVLGASYVNGTFTPQLAVSTDNNIPGALTSSAWDLVQVETGLYYLQILDPDGNAYILAVSSLVDRGCELIRADAQNIANYYTFWAFPYPGQPRIILIYASTKENSISLDAGNYPNVMIFSFRSSVNQTWQFSVSAPFNATPNPPGVSY